MKQDWLMVPSVWRNRFFVAYFGALSFWFLFQFADISERALANNLSATADGQYISDYVQLYTVDKILCSQDKGRMYQPEVQRSWQHKILGERIKQYFTVDNFPLVFLITMPFSALSLNFSHWLWIVSSFVYAGICCYLLTNSSDSRGARKFLPVAILVGLASSAPAHMEFEFGQVNFFVLGCIMCFFLALLKGKEWTAGFFLALTTVKIHLIPFLILACLPNRRLKVLVGTIIFLALIYFCLGFFWGWSNYLEYPVTGLLQRDQIVMQKAMPSLRGVLANSGMTVQGSLIADLVALFIAFICLIVKGYKITMTSTCQRLWFALLISVTLLLVPHSFSNYSVLHVATAALFLPEFFDGVFANSWRANALAWLLLLSPVLSWVSFSSLLFRIPEAYAYVSFNSCIAVLLIGLINDVVSKKFASEVI